LTTGRRSNTAAARRGHHGGFTLLELILVLALIGTVLSMVAPSLWAFCRARETADTAGRILALTQYARSQAVTEGRALRLCVDNDACWLEAQEGGAFAALTSEMGRRFGFPAGASVQLFDASGIEVPHGSVQFGPDGRTEAATIRITGRQGEVYRVVCDSATERFRVASGEGNTP